MTTTVIDNQDMSRYELHADGDLAAFVEYRNSGELTELVHTETVTGFEGRGMASTLIGGVLDELRGRGRTLRPTCPYVRSYLVKHPDQLDLVPDEIRAELLDATS